MKPVIDPTSAATALVSVVIVLKRTWAARASVDIAAGWDMMVGGIMG